LHWNTKYDDGVSYASSDNNIIIQDELKVATSDNEETISEVADK
jgi:hypothetical protein